VLAGEGDLRTAGGNDNKVGLEDGTERGDGASKHSMHEHCQTYTTIDTAIITNATVLHRSCLFVMECNTYTSEKNISHICDHLFYGEDSKQ
jgi:hypothetical protein